MSKRLKRVLFKTLKVLLIVAAPFIVYGIYVAPVFLEHGGANCLNDERRNSTHHDYIMGFQWVPWRDTVVCGIGPPTQDSGNQDYHDGPHAGQNPKPIPPDGERQRSHTDVQTRYWKVRLDYVATSLPFRYHARLGWRWDDVDNIYVFTVSIKRIPINRDLRLLHWETHRYLG